MAYLLFIDESGQDHRASPYEVLAGAAIGDDQLWNLVCAIQDAELEYFGVSFSNDIEELKARKLLKPKVFRQAAWASSLSNPQRAQMASRALMDGPHATRAEISALAQAKIAFVLRILELCALHGVRLFASIVDRDAPRPAGTLLRKDYAYLFERFFYFVDEQVSHQRGLVVFDELEKSQAHILVGQMSAYFRDTWKGRTRAGRIVPEPFFVHSDLTTGVRIADLAAYVISWNVRFIKMSRPGRPELEVMGQRIVNLRHYAAQTSPRTWSFAYIDDLRPKSEQEGE